MPFGRGRAVGANWNGAVNAILGGWQINGITTFQSGTPLSITANNVSGIFSPRQNANNNGQSGKLTGDIHDRLNSYFRHERVQSAGRIYVRKHESSHWRLACAGAAQLGPFRFQRIRNARVPEASVPRRVPERVQHGSFQRSQHQRRIESVRRDQHASEFAAADPIRFEAALVIRAALALIALTACIDAETLRVMSFNVRYPAKGDGPNLWEVRKDLLIDTIRQSAPDIMGTQELFHEQGQYIVEKLPELAWFGLSRRGNKEDEHMGVFYRKETLELLNSGNFWLSTTPEVPGSMSWNVTLPRMVTWGEFRHRKSNRRFYFYNTHFAHRREDAAARTESAKVLAEWLKKLPAQADVILTGDFNTDASTDPYKLLTAILPDALEHAAERKGPDRNIPRLHREARLGSD